MMKESAAWEQRYRLLAGIEEIRVDIPGCRRRPHAQNAVFAVQENFAIFGKMISHQRGQPDSKVDIGAIVNIARKALRQFLPTAFGVAHLRPPATAVAGTRGTFTTRATNIPGVTM